MEDKTSNEPEVEETQAQEQAVVNAPEAVAPVKSQKPRKPNKFRDFLEKNEKIITLIMILMILGIGTLIVFALTGKPEAEEAPATETVTETEPVEEKPFENKLLYAYYEDGITVIRTYDLDDDEKVTLFEFGDDESESEPPDFYENTSRNVSLSKDRSQIAYFDDAGVHLANVDGSGMKTLITTTYVESSNPLVDVDKYLDTAEITANGTKLKESGKVPEYLAIYSPMFGADNTLGYSVAAYEGGSIELLNLGTNSLVNLGNTFTYIAEPVAGQFGFEKTPQTQILLKAMLYPDRAIKIISGELYGSAYSEDGQFIGTLAIKLKSAGGGTFENLDDDKKVFSIIDTTTFMHQEVAVFALGTEKIYGGTNFYVIEKADFNPKTENVFKEYTPDGKLVREVVVNDIAGLTGEVVDTDVYEINGKVYLEINTKFNNKYKSHVYDLDEKDILVEFNVASDGNFQLLDRF